MSTHLKNPLHLGLVTPWLGIKFIVKKLWRVIRLYVPGTQPFKRYKQRQIGQQVQRVLRLLVSLPDLPTLDSAAKRRLFPLVRHHANNIYALDIWEDIIVTSAEWSILAVFFGLWICSTNYFQRLVQPISFGDTSQLTPIWFFPLTIDYPLYVPFSWFVLGSAVICTLP
jgi:hypothetical protein